MSFCIANTLPRPYSIPYATKIKNGLSETRWIQFVPGVSVDIDNEIWELISTHPDVKVMIEEKNLIPINLSDPKTENFSGVEAITDGKLAKILEQPVPIGTASGAITKSNVGLTPEQVEQLKQLSDEENLISSENQLEDQNLQKETATINQKKPK